MRLSSLPWQIVCCVSIGLLVVACQDDSVDSDADGHAGSASTGGGSVGGAGGTGGQPSTGGTGMGGLGGDNSTGGTTSTQPLYPETLRGTGLYEAGSETLMPGVREFTPRFALYSDNASKRRFIWLPPGEPINTLDQDYWDFPVGTKLWKEFSRSGIRVETRYLEKLPSGAFVRIAYQWNDAQTDALPVPDGVQNASTTDHDIPSEEDCRLCHTRTRGEVLGFSQLQLGYDSAQMDAADLNSGNLVTDAVQATLTVPGDAAAQAALGYLHVNCGTCHNPTSSVQARVDMDLRLRVALLASVEATPAYTTSVGVDNSLATGQEPLGAPSRITAGDSAASSVYVRMNTRGESYSMPPLGTEDVDAAGSAVVATWIDALVP